MTWTIRLKRKLKPYLGWLKRDRYAALLAREYARSKDFSFVQIGANDGVKFDVLYDFVTRRRCRGLVVEPLPYYFDKLKANYAAHPQIVPVRCAVHSTLTKCEIYHVDPARLAGMPEWAAGIGSFDPEHHKRSGTPAEAIVAEEVECLHLMELLRRHGLAELNLLQVDVEGYDGEVIRMIDFDVVRPRIIRYEHASLDPAERASLERLLASQRYRLFAQGCDTVAVSRPG